MFKRIRRALSRRRRRRAILRQLDSACRGDPAREKLKWWAKQSTDMLKDRDKLHNLYMAYQTAKGSLWWQHFFGLLANAKLELERQLREGLRDQHGRDKSDELRAAIGVLEQVMALPDDVCSRHERLIANQRALAKFMPRR